MLGLGVSINKSFSSESASIAGRSSSFTGLLDESYGGSASAAYSVRRLSGSYSGKALQIRRVSDNVEVDVSFDNNNEISLDSAVTNVTEETTGSSTNIITRAVNLGEFVANASYTDADSLGSTDSAKVQCWYDQSGSSNDTTQNTAGSQPTIVSSGALVTENGKPAVQFDGSNDFFSTNQSIRTATVFIVEKGSQSGRNTLFGSSSSGQEYLRTEGTTIRFQNSSNYVILTGQTSGAHNLIYLDNVSSTTSLANNGGSPVTANIDTGAISDFVIGQKTNKNFYSGNLQEMIIYNPSQSSNRTGIESNVNTFYSIY